MANNFLENLQIGQEVCYDISNTSYPNYVINKVKKITPTGRIVLENGETFNKEGTKSIDMYRHYFIKEVTQEIRDEIKRVSYIIDIKKETELLWKTDLRNLSLEHIQMIFDLMNKISCIRTMKK